MASSTSGLRILRFHSEEAIVAYLAAHPKTSNPSDLTQRINAAVATHLKNSEKTLNQMEGDVMLTVYHFHYNGSLEELAAKALSIKLTAALLDYAERRSNLDF